MQINHLTLKTRRDKATAVRFQLENALRVSTRENRRLLLVRKVDLGKLPQGDVGRKLDRHIGTRMAVATAGAIHGSLSSAAGSNAVWFRSKAEALSHFWQLILQGKMPSAWYWKLAIAGWKGQPPAIWVSEQLVAAKLDARTRIFVGDAMTGAAKTGHSHSIIALFAQIPVALLVAFAPVPSKQSNPSASRNRLDAPNIGAGVENGIGHWKETRSAGVLRNSVVRETIRLALMAGREDIARSIACFAIASSRPDWAGSLDRLLPRAQFAVTSIALETESEPPERQARNMDQSPNFGSDKPGHVQDDPVRRDRPDHEPQSARRETAANSDEPDTPSLADNKPTAISVSAERIFDKAGLFLTIPLLHRIGIAEAIDKQRLATQHNFAAQLLIYMARSYGEGEGWAMRQWLGIGEDETAQAQREMDELLCFWARIADKALRKIARRRLHDLARRTGWLMRDEETIDVRFPLASADIFLRRHALDVDPGWVPWLGRVVHFHFADVPLDEQS